MAKANRPHKTEAGTGRTPRGLPGKADVDAPILANLMGLLFTNSGGIDAVFNTRLDLGGSVLGGWGRFGGVRVSSTSYDVVFL